MGLRVLARNLQLLQCDTHSAPRMDVRPLHGDGNTVKEYDDQNNMVEHLVVNDVIALISKPDKKRGSIKLRLQTTSTKHECISC